MSIGLALAVLAMSGTVQAQPVMQVVQGTIQLADCAENIITLNADDGSHTFTVSSATAVYVDSAVSSFCTLSHYVGARATVWTAGRNGAQMVAGRVDVALMPVTPAPYYNGPYYGCGPVCCGPYYGPWPCFYPFGVGVDTGPSFPDRDIDHDRGRPHDRDGGHDRGSGGRGGAPGGYQGGGHGRGSGGGFHGGSRR